jgi:butyryl-CoA dehydrogenase
MVSYAAPMRDYQFVLTELLDGGSVASLPGYEDATPDTLMAVLEEAGKFCANELLPLNMTGDAEGCTYENGVVRTPKGFKQAYDAYCAGGWNGLTGSPEWGGQGLPRLLGAMFTEMICSTNLSFGTYPGLTAAAAEAIEQHATPEMKARYLPNMVTGKWSGAMCLTEPHCGTDLGLMRTRAEPRDDGTYAISGTKIFITAGEHDLTENIIYLVLARLPDAPKGSRGISLFLVPKFLLKSDDTVGPRNGVRCGSIEHKMGIKASATCVMNFDEATGWLIGEPHRGLHAMFTMMNAARLGTAIQGVGLAEVAYQNARDYAKQRQQGRSLSGVKFPDQPADPIIVHPDVRRMLLTAKANVEGSRALAAWVGLEIDHMQKHPDAGRRQEAEDLVALMLPILKAYFTDAGFEATNLAVQVLGGHGYIKEWGLEQLVRDARIAQLYEGANGIQALDLVGRKMPMHMGRLLRRFFHPVERFIEDNRDEDDLEEFVQPLEKVFGRLQQAVMHLAVAGLKDAEEAGAGATDFLKLFALTALAFVWARSAKIALANQDGDEAQFYKAKLATARFFFARVLPQSSSLFATIMAGAKSLMEIDAAAM